MTPRVSWWLTIVTAAPLVAAQPVAEPRATRLADAVSTGMLELLSARLDHLGDMATTDLAPLDDGPYATAEGDGGTEGSPSGATETPTLWQSCGIDGPVRPVDLREGDLLPVGLTLASRGSRAVALVALGRPGGTRQGMAFPESRWVELEGDRAQVFVAPGFPPDNALALGDGQNTVLSYVHQPSHQADRVPHDRRHEDEIPTTLTFTRVDARGRTLLGPRPLVDTDNLRIDSPLVDWRGGNAVVLGEYVNHPNESRRRESLYFFDRAGHRIREPLELTTDGFDNTLGTPCAGLAVSPDRRSLIVSWAVPQGPLAGVWVRRGITLQARPFLRGTAHILPDPPPPPGTRPKPPLFPRGMWVFRVAQGNGFWGPQSTPAGVIFHRHTRPWQALAPVSDVVFAPWPQDRRHITTHVLGTWWDPLTVWTPGGAIVTGQSPLVGSRDELPASESSLGYMAVGGDELRTIAPNDLARLSALSEAVDIALAPTSTGAVIAWIEPADAHDDTARRRLAMARVGCRNR